MKTGRLLPLMTLALCLIAGCATKEEAAMADLKKMAKKHQIDDVSPSNFVNCAQLSNREAVRLYLDSGMSVDARNPEGRTALMGAAAADPGAQGFNHNEEIIRLLIASKADVNAVDKRGYSAFQIAKDLNRVQVVKILAEAGAKEFPMGIPTPTPIGGTVQEAPPQPGPETAQEPVPVPTPEPAPEAEPTAIPEPTEEPAPTPEPKADSNSEKPY